MSPRLYSANRQIACLAISAAALCAAPDTSHAQGAVYGELGAGELALTKLGTGDVKISLPVVRLGYQSNSFWFVEAEGFFGTGTGSKTYIQVNDASALGAFIGGKYDLTEQHSVFARLGAERVQFKAANTAALSPLQPRTEYDATLVVFGLGAIWMIDEENGLRFDATVSNEEEGAPRFFSAESGARALTLSYRRKF
jgi:hypothetical protein